MEIDGIRALVNARLEGNLIHLSIKWVEVVNNEIKELEKPFKEEFKISTEKSDCSYLSRACFPPGLALPGTFWLDEKGNRHFYINADAGKVGAIGSSM